MASVVLKTLPRWHRSIIRAAGVPGSLSTTTATIERSFSSINGDTYKVSPEAVEQFHQDGYITLENVILEEELQQLEEIYDEFSENRRKGIDFGRDYGDHSQGHGVDPKDFNMRNVNVPTRHDPTWANNLFERRGLSIAKQLWHANMVKDYEQLLTKLANRPTAVFPWHQDMAYWPKLAKAPTDTATVSFALNDANEENGCLLVLPESHKPKSLYGSHTGDGLAKHNKDTEDARALVLELNESDKEKVVPVPCPRGGATVHDEWIVHASSGNRSNGPRKTYVVAYRDQNMVEYERGIGFSHSYNDDPTVLAAIRRGDF